MNMSAVLRVARPTDNISQLHKFYVNGLGFDVLYQFQNHDGFDGMIVGKEGSPYHLEFTSAYGHSAGRSPSKDNLLVFYLPDRIEWENAVNRMMQLGFDQIPSFNPYWDKQGATFEDPDGYRVVLQNAHW